MYPSFKLRCNFEGVNLEGGGLENLLRDMWVQDIFQVRFVYWPQHKLLALCGDNYPEAVESLFGPQVAFQNCTDQDYEVDVWDSNISISKPLSTAFQKQERRQSSLYWDTMQPTRIMLAAPLFTRPCTRLSTWVIGFMAGMAGLSVSKCPG